jgi:5-methylcytosine-specific restriction endonuclease McrA
MANHAEALTNATAKRYYASMRHIAIYGDVKILRDRCPDCRRNALIVDGCFLCCGLSAKEIQPKRIKRMSTGCGSRNLPPAADRNSVLLAQENRCFYCEREFGEFYRLGRRTSRLTVNWDHLVPYAYLNSSPPANFVAACRDCNAAKGSMMFQTIEEARIYVRSRLGFL